MKIWKSLVLAVVVVAIAYLTLLFSEVIFKSDYRFWVFAIRPMTALQFPIFLCYLIPFAFYFLVISMILHGELRRGRTGEIRLWQEMLINIFLMITGYILFEAVAYGPLFAGGTLQVWSPRSGPLSCSNSSRSFAIAALIMTYYFRKTGHVYAGAFMCAILVTWIVVAGQATHFAF